MTDVADVALSQAIVCAYAVPVVGAVAAIPISILQAVYDSAKSDDVPIGQYSASQALADLGTKIGNQIHVDDQKKEEATIKGWQLSLSDADASTPGYAVTGAAAFLADHDFNKTFGGLLDSDPNTEERVQALGDHFLARIAFHSLCKVWLDKLELGRQFDPIKTATLSAEIHSRYLKSLTDAVDFARDTVNTLDETYRHAREKATGRSGTPVAGVTDAVSVNLVRAQQLRQIRRDGFLEYATPADIHEWRQYIVLFDTTIAALQIAAHPKPFPLSTTPAPTPTDQQATTGPASTISVDPPGTVTVMGPSVRPVSETRTVSTSPASLGARPAGVARFLYESDPAGGWVNVVGDSAVSPGPLVTQDAGSTLHPIYYEIGGRGVNGEFADQLDKAAALDGANADLVTAYDALWGDGAHAADAAGTPPRQDRLTSFLVLLANGVPPIGESVYGVLYSVGPQLGDKGIEDTDAYKKIYTDGLAAIAAWNRNNDTPIVNLRLTLVSAGLFAGESGGPALRAQAAGLVIDAVVAAMRTMPEIATLTLLVNTNDTPIADGDERIAFDTAVRARSLTTTRTGFDVPLS